MSLIGYLTLYGDLERARARYPELFGTYLSDDVSVARMELVLTDSASVTTAMHLVRELRRSAAEGLSGLEGATVLLGGFAAAQVDEEANLRAGFPGMVALILGASGLMLLVAFRSVLMPIKAIALNLLSLAGAFGMLVLVFQLGVGSRVFGLTEPTEALFIHVLVMVFAMSFGMSLDYEVFLIARIKEAVDAGLDDSTATVDALTTTAGVITSAAAIMVVVFGAFVFSRIPMAQLLAFGLAMAVLIDATIVRLVIVPAFMRIAGRWNWWPGAGNVKREE
jgi:RND superfamily putative drug exporter